MKLSAKSTGSADRPITKSYQNESWAGLTEGRIPARGPAREKLCNWRMYESLRVAARSNSRDDNVSLPQANDREPSMVDLTETRLPTDPPVPALKPKAGYQTWTTKSSLMAEVSMRMLTV
jgi:hypothetical protein